MGVHSHARSISWGWRSFWGSTLHGVTTRLQFQAVRVPGKGRDGYFLRQQTWHPDLGEWLSGPKFRIGEEDGKWRNILPAYYYEENMDRAEMFPPEFPNGFLGLPRVKEWRA